MIETYAKEIVKIIADLEGLAGDFIEQMADDFLDTLNDGRKIFVCGNGGSFTQAQHFAAEFMVRPSSEAIYWSPKNVIALGSNPAFLTACSNDFNYSQIFERELQILGKRGDFLLILSTSGNSHNLERVCRLAKVRGIKTFSLLGQVKDVHGGKLTNLSDVSLVVLSSNVARIQEAHLFILHCICQIIMGKLKK